MIELWQDHRGIWAVNSGWTQRRAVAPDDISYWVANGLVKTKTGPNGAPMSAHGLIDAAFMDRIKDVSPGTPQLTPGETQAIVDATVAGVVARIPVSSGTPVDVAALAEAVANELHQRLQS